MTIARVAGSVGGLRHEKPSKFRLGFNKGHLGSQGSKACERPEQMRCAQGCLLAPNIEGEIL
jgi:hypothetical protein